MNKMREFYVKEIMRNYKSGKIKDIDMQSYALNCITNPHRQDIENLKLIVDEQRKYIKFHL